MTLSFYLEDYLGGLLTQLGWSVADDNIAFIESEALRLYGVSTEALATDLNKLYAIAKVEAWKRVLTEISFDYDYTANGGSFKRSQMYTQAKQNLEDAISDAMVYLDNYTIDTGILGGDEKDPYSNYPYDER